MLLKISQNSQENICVRVSALLKKIYSKSIPAHVFSCECFDFIKNTYPVEHLQTAATCIDDDKSSTVTYQSY